MQHGWGSTSSDEHIMNNDVYQDPLDIDGTYMMGQEYIEEHESNGMNDLIEVMTDYKPDIDGIFLNITNDGWCREFTMYESAIHVKLVSLDLHDFGMQTFNNISYEEVTQVIDVVIPGHPIIQPVFK